MEAPSPCLIHPLSLRSQLQREQLPCPHGCDLVDGPLSTPREVILWAGPASSGGQSSPPPVPSCRLQECQAPGPPAGRDSFSGHGQVGSWGRCRAAWLPRPSPSHLLRGEHRLAERSGRPRHVSGHFYTVRCPHRCGPGKQSGLDKQVLEFQFSFPEDLLLSPLEGAREEAGREEKGAPPGL